MLGQKQNPQTKKDQQRNQFKSLFFGVKSLFSQRFIRVSVLAAVTVWTIWLILAGPSRALSNLLANWEVAVTMVFGSMVAGGTGLGGGAVAFPVFTKLLHVHPHEAKVFSLAIQSVGMSAASLTIVAMNTKVEWRFIYWASFAGFFGIILGEVFLAPILPRDVIKFSFTMMISSFALVLLVSNKTKWKRNLAIPYWRNRERIISLLAGFMGGIISSLLGTGMDVFCFSVMVLLFGVSEKISIPTSVILMSINAVIGFILHKYFIGDFVQPVISYWLAAIPVVIVGAPAGAILCRNLTRKTIGKILIGLIFIELISSIVFIPLNATVISSSLIVFILFCLIYYWMYQTQKIYIETEVSHSSGNLD